MYPHFLMHAFSLNMLNEGLRFNMEKNEHDYARAIKKISSWNICRDN